MRTIAARARALIVILLVGSAVLFVIGTTLERNESESEEPALVATGSEAAESEEAERGEAARSEAGEGKEGEEGGERIFGIDPDSPWTVTLAVVASLVLAASVALVGSSPVLVLTGLFALAFAAGDLRELVRQLDESNTGIAVVAVVLVVAHLLIGTLSALLVRRRLASAQTAGQPAS